MHDASVSISFFRIRDIMFNIFLLVLPIFLVLFLGNVMMRLTLMTPDFTTVANRLIYNVCLPVLLFYKIAESRFDEVFSLKLIVIMAVAVGIMFIISFPVSYLLRFPKTSAGTFAMLNFRANYAYMGLPVSYYAFGDQGLAVGSIFMAFIVPYVNMLSVVALNLSGTQRFDRMVFLKNTLFNPLAVACFLGILFSLFSVPLPRFFLRTLEIISGVTLPLALFAIGATTNMDRLRGSIRMVSVSTIMKLAVLPMLAFIIVKLTGIPITLPEKVMIVMLASPSATVNYVLASVLDGDTDVAAGSIVASTLLSIVSFVLWIHHLSI